MSRAITLIDLQASPSGEPASIADFGDLLVALQGQGPARNPKFVDFARQELHAVLAQVRGTGRMGAGTPPGR